MTYSNDKATKIALMMANVPCNKETAIAYLESEEWLIAEAIKSYKLDNK